MKNIILLFLLLPVFATSQVKGVTQSKYSSDSTTTRGLINAITTTITNLGTASTLNVPASGNAASGEVVKGNDTRLVDARTAITQIADYIINTDGTTVTATPRNGTALATYSNTSFNTVISSTISALTGGGLIHINRGTYSGLSVISIATHGITIEGDGKYATILIMKPSADIGVSSATALFNISDSNNVIRNLQLDGNGANQTKIDNNATLTARLNGIYSSGNNTIVEDCYIHDWTQYGFYGALYATNNIVRKSKIINNYWNGITFDENTTRCQALDNEVAGSADVGISAYGSQHTIDRNYVHDIVGLHGSTGSSWGIGAEVGGSSPDQTKITNNLVTGLTMKKGIFLAQSTNCLVDHNFVFSVRGSNAAGIYLAVATNNTVSNNYVYNVLTTGLYLDASYNNTIRSNTIYNVVDAAKIEAYDGGSVNRNIVLGNYLYGSGNGLIVNATGVGTAVENIVEGNTVSDFTDNGSGTSKTNNFGLIANAWLPGKEDAKVNTSTTVNGHALSSNLTISASDVGLGNVSNTSDATKNTATATLTNKTISGASNTLSNIPESAVTNLSADLSAKAPATVSTRYIAPIGYLPINDLGVPNDPAGANTIDAVKFYLPCTITVNTLQMIVRTAGTTGATIYAGIYDASGNKVISTSAIAATTTGLKSGTVTSTTLQPGFYWASYVSTDNTVRIEAFSNSGSAFWENGSRGISSNVVSGGAMPATLGTISGYAGGNGPLILLSN